MSDKIKQALPPAMDYAEPSNDPEATYVNEAYVNGWNSCRTAALALVAQPEAEQPTLITINGTQRNVLIAAAEALDDLGAPLNAADIRMIVRYVAAPVQPASNSDAPKQAEPVAWTDSTPLPWRITEVGEKKGPREIVGTNGATVAKLTALDMANAELIVRSVNPAAQPCQDKPTFVCCGNLGPHNGPDGLQNMCCGEPIVTSAQPCQEPAQVRNAALEEAAKLCEAEAQHVREFKEWMAMAACDTIARKLRELQSRPAPARDDVLQAIQGAVPLVEPVHIAKALRAGREAKVCLAGGTGPLACVMLVNIQLTPWIHTEETAKAFADGYNKALKQLRAALLEVAQSQPAPEAGLSQPCQSMSDAEILEVARKQERLANYVDVGPVQKWAIVEFARAVRGEVKPAKTGEAG